MKLTPPDLERCQAEIRPAHGFMVLGPPPKAERCKRKPTFIAKETSPGKDGLLGSMALCDSCKTVCEKQLSGVTFEPVTR